MLNLVAAMQTYVIPIPPWVRWVFLAAAVLFTVALTVLLVVIARRSHWPDRGNRSDR